MSVIDVAVIGVGGVGSSALMHLAKRGLKVVGSNNSAASKPPRTISVRHTAARA